MKILMIAPTPFFADRGCHTRILNEILGLQELGHSILLCTYRLGNDVESVNTVRSFNFPWYKKLSAGPSVTKIFLLPCLFFTAIEQIIKLKPDIVHAFLHEGAFIARLCNIFCKKPAYVFDCQGSLTGELLQHNFIRKNSLLYKTVFFLERKINNWFPVITQSEQLMNYLNETSNNKYILNSFDCVDVNLFKPMNKNIEIANKINLDINKPTMLYMGLLEKYQGIDVMLEAFSEVVKAVPECQLIVIGFPNIDKYNNMCISLEILNNVIFLGKVSYFDLPFYLSLSNIAIAPKISEHEGDGKIYNYMAMGMGIITFERSVSKEILGDDSAFPTALFSKFNDCHDLKEKMIFLLNNSELISIMGRNGRERVSANFTHIMQAKKIESFYNELLQKSNKHK